MVMNSRNIKPLQDQVDRAEQILKKHGDVVVSGSKIIVRIESLPEVRVSDTRGGRPVALESGGRQLSAKMESDLRAAGIKYKITDRNALTSRGNERGEGGASITFVIG